MTTTKLTLQLITKTPMHIGAGFSVKVPYLKSDGTRDKADFALVQTDGDGNPYIPGTTLKGVLRALLELDDAKRLFGDVGDQGKPGAVIVGGGKFDKMGSTVGRRDIITSASGDVANRGTLMVQRVAIDQATGTAADKKLFLQEMVPPGTTFIMTLRLSDRIKLDDPLLTALLKQLHEVGIHLGRGTNDGSGHLALAGDTVTVTDAASAERTLDINTLDGDMTALRQPRKTYQVTLSGADTFGVLGVTNRKEGDKESNNRLEALRSAGEDKKGGNAELPGSSLSGAMRAKANWFAARQLLREGMTDSDERRETLNHPDHPIQRLFGRDADVVKKHGQSFAGTLKITAIKATDSGPRDMPQIKIDRITQGTIDGALFEMQMFMDARFDVTFEIDARASDNDVEFARAFFEYLKDKSDPSSGLMLGHASTRGHGWFDVTVNGEAG
ncbi:MAG: RAMP superfamily CRISPR-associated protein [Ahrensia sp.]